MRIRRIAAYRVQLPLREGRYAWRAASRWRSSTRPSSAWRPTRASRGTAKSARSGRPISPRTPPACLFSATDFNSYVTVRTAEGAPQRVRGCLAAPTAPGLGVRPLPEVLGTPVLDVR